MKPLLSICIPTLNRRDFLELCLDRIFKQIGDRDDIEVVVGNNASSDGTAELLADLATRHHQLRFINRPVTLDLALQFVATLLLGRGEWCVYLADDDWLKVDVILDHIDAMRARSDVVAIYCDWVAWDDQAEVELHRYFVVGGERQFSLQQAPALLDYMLAAHVLPEVAIYRRVALDEAMVVGLPSSFYQMLLGLLKAGVVIFRDPSFYYECRVTKPHLARKHWANMDLGSTQIDDLRSGFENFALGALSASQHLPLPQPNRLALYDAIQGFLTHRLLLFRQRAIGSGNCRAALRIDDRIRLWYPAAALPLQGQDNQVGYANLVVWAALQSIAERARTMAECRKIFLVSPRAAGMEGDLRNMAAEFAIEVLADDQNYRVDLSALYVVHGQDELESFLAQGGARDSVLVMARLLDAFGNATKVILE